MAGRERFKPNIWYDVPPKKNRKSDQHQYPKVSIDGVKFFVSNLPEGCSSSDLKEVLLRYGDVQGIYIARKYDKLGKRFGFATFKVTRNRADLEENLKDVWIGSYKLYIVPARFVGDQKHVGDNGKKIDPSAHKETVWKPVTIPEVQEQVVNQNEGDRMDVEGNNLQELYGCGVIAEASSLDVLTSLKTKLKEAAFVGFKIRYVGGLTVLLSFENVLDKDRFLNDNDGWKSWLKTAESWIGQVVKTDRVAWIKIRGLPMHVAEMKSFNEIAGMFGTVIAEAHYPEEGDISYAIVGISLQSHARVGGSVKVVWKDSSYLVYVEEDLEEWFPECVVDLDEEAEEWRVDSVEIPAAVTTNAVLSSEQEPVQHMVEDQEALPHLNGHFNDSVGAGSISKSCKRKGGKYSKKKGCYRRSTSPSDKDRPKKRVREDNDIFDIDRFIFDNPVQVVVDNSSVNQPQQDEFITPDLNSSVAPCLAVEGNDNAREIHAEVIRREVEDTLLFARDLGVSNMDSFQEPLANAVNEESFQRVDQ
ncbi:RNA-directed DNA polymerase, eukaryota, Nucleotide-binding alpha-beta plait domain protein [Artemisia annua]|uniref:RNA-directed DNA polymerase, eukaryota, Nucleotide-binding alpha-beta plait domain protein n=1 Tax=Artemisia annua TaxID=35608 RepID=A0A2U1PSK3_ARTAN|nr:RNA-directed DNA polymerase, eukaryota, Nucleotide-binding alpha-beta plait domain protein [Artemisia annua]